MIFKICGLKKKDSLLCCEKNNVDLFGIIFYEKSPRSISLTEAKELVNYSKDLKIKPVGVFVNESIFNLKNLLHNLKLKFIQLHGDEDQPYINSIKENFPIKIIKKISVRTYNDLKKINYYKNIDYLLFDYKPDQNELPGGNAKSFDWNLLKNQNIPFPWFISGEINESNIKKIQKTVNPHGIDLSSGVEASPGIKSNIKINSIFKKFYDN